MSKTVLNGSGIFKSRRTGGTELHAVRSECSLMFGPVITLPQPNVMKKTLHPAFVTVLG